MTPPPFAQFNETGPATPIVITVPHAGRIYPELPFLRVPIARLRSLEDRYADDLAAMAIANGVTALIAQAPRLLIDLNRAETELDPAMVRGAATAGTPLAPRTRGGLGLIPRRLPDVGEIWRGPLDAGDVTGRIAGHHRPWHATTAALLESARQKFGVALLIDLHSMPPLDGDDAPSIVIGDRFGRSAAPRLTAAAEAVATGAGFRVAINAPYAGGYALDRHARPRDGVHALQVEIDRQTYLDARLDLPGPGLPQMQTLVADLARRLAQEILPPLRIAAE